MFKEEILILMVMFYKFVFFPAAIQLKKKKTQKHNSVVDVLTMHCIDYFITKFVS